MFLNGDHILFFSFQTNLGPLQDPRPPGLPLPRALGPRRRRRCAPRLHGRLRRRESRLALRLPRQTEGVPGRPSKGASTGAEGVSCTGATASQSAEEDPLAQSRPGVGEWQRTVSLSLVSFEKLGDFCQASSCSTKVCQTWVT